MKLCGVHSLVVLREEGRFARVGRVPRASLRRSGGVRCPKPRGDTGGGGGLLVAGGSGSGDAKGPWRWWQAEPAGPEVSVKG